METLQYRLESSSEWLKIKKHDLETLMRNKMSIKKHMQIFIGDYCQRISITLQCIGKIHLANYRSLGATNQQKLVQLKKKALKILEQIEVKQQFALKAWRKTGLQLLNINFPQKQFIKRIEQDKQYYDKLIIIIKGMKNIRNDNEEIHKAKIHPKVQKLMNLRNYQSQRKLYVQNCENLSQKQLNSAPQRYLDQYRSVNPKFNENYSRDQLIREQLKRQMMYELRRKEQQSTEYSFQRDHLPKNIKPIHNYNTITTNKETKKNLYETPQRKIQTRKNVESTKRIYKYIPEDLEDNQFEINYDHHKQANSKYQYGNMRKQKGLKDEFGHGTSNSVKFVDTMLKQEHLAKNNYNTIKKKDYGNDLLIFKSFGQDQLGQQLRQQLNQQESQYANQTLENLLLMSLASSRGGQLFNSDDNNEDSLDEQYTAYFNYKNEESNRVNEDSLDQEYSLKKQ